MMLDLHQQLNEKDYPVYLGIKQFSSFVYAVGSVKNRDFELLWKYFEFFFLIMIKFKQTRREKTGMTF